MLPMPAAAPAPSASTIPRRQTAAQVAKAREVERERKALKAKAGIEEMYAQQRADLAAAAEAERMRFRQQVNAQRACQDAATLEASKAQETAMAMQYLLEVGTAARQNLGETLYGASRGVSTHDAFSIHRTIFSRDQ